MQRKTVFSLLSRDKIRSKGQILEQRMQRKNVSSCSTSQMEWAANPQMVSSHRTEILILDVFHFRGIARLGIGLLVRVADGEDVVQLVVSGDIKTVEKELAFLV